MKKIGALRFGLWAVMMTAGFVALLFGDMFAFTLILGFSGFLSIRRDAISRGVPKREIATIAFVLAAFILAACIVRRLWSDHQVMDVLSHPLFVLPVWFLILAVNFNGWRRNRQTSVTS
jgi:CDP-diglyceride synthetase